MSTPVVAHLMQLKVKLQYISPPIWRRLLLPPESTLGDLHGVIQDAMGWRGYHLHSFRLGERCFGSTDIEELDWEDENAYTIGAVLVTPGKKMRYTYDFGDDWEHEVLFEKLIPAEPDQQYPQCTAGKRACPPEDCGSYPGYSRLCQLIKNPELPDPLGLRGWVGRDFDPDAFDLAETNRRLSRHWTKTGSAKKSSRRKRCA